MNDHNLQFAHDVVGAELRRHLSRTQEAAARLVDPVSDQEAVHDLRVGMRRLRTVLSVSDKVYGKAQLAELRNELKSFGAASSALRDHEVLQETLTAHAAFAPEAIRAWLQTIEQDEHELRAPVVALVKTAQFKRCLHDLNQVIQGAPKRMLPAHKFAKRQLRRAQKRTRALLPTPNDNDGGEKLHRLRIRFKGLRYTTEMFRRQLPTPAATIAEHELKPDSAPSWSEIAKHAANMQDRLGSLHDVEYALSALAAADSLPPTQRTKLKELLGEQHAELNQRALDELSRLPHFVLRNAPKSSVQALTSPASPELERAQPSAPAPESFPARSDAG